MMVPGSVVADRFEIEALAGSGGMSNVYRARDRLSGERVALKLLRYQAAHASRFRREAELLAGLDHPGIVRYVAHSEATGRSPAFMAMEWLEGESLRDRLTRGALGIDESITLMRRAALALGRAHTSGVVHRDVKPENLFLVDGRVDRVKVLDFGVALGADVSRRMTVTGIPMGTVGYMSPEQVRAEGNVDARADVFALGLVFFECLTGMPTFAASHPLAVLAKIVCEAAPRVSDFRCVPEELDELVARMLEKDPARRLADGAGVACSLGEIEGSTTEEEQAPPPRRSVVLGTQEQQVVTAVVAVDNHVDGHETLPLEDFRRRDRELAALVERFGGRFEPLSSAGFLALFSGRSTASDSALRAVRCALALPEVVPEAKLAVVTGSAVASRRLPVAEVVDRAVALLKEATGAGAHIDDATLGLLPSRFEVRQEQGRAVLLGEKKRDTWSFPGDRPCVARERELETLAAVLDECASEPVARVVLLTGAPGVGKSRIVRELLRKNEGRPIPFEVWAGRADPLCAGAPFALLADVLSNGLGLGLADGDPRLVLEGRVALHLEPADAARVGVFLAEILGMPFPDSDRAQLRAARGDRGLMRDQIQRAFFDLLEHECRAHPLMIVVDDLHWGDRPSLELVDAALRRSPELPLLVLGAAHPDLYDVLPNLFAERALQVIRVRELGRRAAATLVRAALSDSVDEAEVNDLVETSAGNALFLEELLRARADGRRDPPQSVLAMIRARLEAMEPEARRVLRAASIYGRTFLAEAVGALVADVDPARLEQWLVVLVERGVLERMPGSEAKGRQLCFRQPLGREAAYGMLTDADLQLGHRLAAAWLVGHGEHDARLVAEHHEKGGMGSAAAPWWERAASSALEANALDASLECVKRGVDAGAQGATLGALRLIEAEAHRWAGDLGRAALALVGALELLPQGDVRWYHAAAERALVLQRLGETEDLSAFARRLLSRSVKDEPSNSLAHALARTGLCLLLGGRGEMAIRLIGAVSDLERAGVALEPATRAQRHVFQALSALYRADLGTYLKEEIAAQACFEEAGDVRRALNESGSIGYAYMELGAYVDAERALDRALAQAERLELEHVCAACHHNLGMVYARRGRFSQARAAEARAVQIFRSQRDRRLEAAALAYLAQIELLEGDFDAAAQSADSALEVAREAAPPIVPLPLAIQAAVELGRGRVQSACEISSRAMALIAGSKNVEAGETLARLTRSEALLSAGREDEARNELQVARQRLLERASQIDDPRFRASFLEQVPENARTLELAERFGQPRS